MFLDYLKNSPTSKYWYPVFAVMIGTGLRVGEVTGLRWCDIDLEEGIIDVNHTLVYYDHRTEAVSVAVTSMLIRPKPRQEEEKCLCSVSSKKHF